MEAESAFRPPTKRGGVDLAQPVPRGRFVGACQRDSFRGSPLLGSATGF